MIKRRIAGIADVIHHVENKKRKYAKKNYWVALIFENRKEKVFIYFINPGIKIRRPSFSKLLLNKCNSVGEIIRNCWHKSTKAGCCSGIHLPSRMFSTDIEVCLNLFISILYSIYKIL